MTRSRTGAERYLDGRRKDPEYARAHERARSRIDHADRVIRALDERRQEMGLSKAELARRAGVQPEAIRRLFSADRPNPTLLTLAAIADALGLDLAPGSRRTVNTRVPSPTRGRSAAPGTRRRTA